MEQFTYDDRLFDRINYSGNIVNGTEFESCRFKNCDFSNSIFTNNKFLDCVFEDCNLSLIKLSKTTLSNTRFNNCKLLGIIFSECQDFLFSVKFESCILDYSSFMGKKMPKTYFIKSSLKEVNFTRTNLSGSVFNETDLADTLFNGTDLTAANFLTAFNYMIDPELNNLKKACFSLHGLPGLLTRHQLKIS